MPLIEPRIGEGFTSPRLPLKLFMLLRLADDESAIVLSI
jgi:hypothetical protein